MTRKNMQRRSQLIGIVAGSLARWRTVYKYKHNDSKTRAMSSMVCQSIELLIQATDIILDNLTIKNYIPDELSTEVEELRS
jgi:pectin methylesterase-like acyl-CoA thioesterase